ncbi:MAG TPA: hypothetical protein VF755_29125 [Catenuloplanes sp.]|jgi:hypothetical protein
MVTRPRFPDAQVLLAEVLLPLVGAGRVGSQTPPNLQQALPFIRVVRAGGRSDRLCDFARVEVDVFHRTYAEGSALAGDVQEFLTTQRLRSPTGLVDRVAVEVAPVEVPWASGVRRFGARYLIVTRRTRRR